MTRSVPLWTAKHDDAPIPKAVIENDDDILTINDLSEVYD